MTDRASVGNQRCLQYNVRDGPPSWLCGANRLTAGNLAVLLRDNPARDDFIERTFIGVFSSRRLFSHRLEYQ